MPIVIKPKKNPKGIVLSAAKFDKRFPNVKQPTVKSVARSVKKIQRQQELKWIDTAYTSGSISQSGNFQLLNGVAQGTTDITRIGSEINVTSVQFRGVVALPTTMLDSVVARHIIFWDRQANEGAPTISTLLDLVTFSSAGQQVYAPYNHDFQKRYKILYDKVHTLTPQTLLDFDPATGTTSTVNSVIKHSHKKIPAKRTVKYSGTGATIASIETNSMYSVWLTNSSTNLSGTVMYRVFFKD